LSGFSRMAPAKRGHDMAWAQRERLQREFMSRAVGKILKIHSVFLLEKGNELMHNSGIWLFVRFGD